MSALFDEEGAFSTKDLEDVPTKKEEIVDEFVEDDAVFDVRAWMRLVRKN